MTRKIKVAAIQMSCGTDRNGNLDKAENLFVMPQNKVLK